MVRQYVSSIVVCKWFKLELIFFLEGDAPGLSQEDMQASIATLKSIADSLALEMAQLRERKEGEGLVTEFLLRRSLEFDDFMEVR